jgi:Fe-S-cluster containining protein
MSTVVRSLSFHARYHCRHSGACCTSGWPIPVEVDRLTQLHAAISTGALQPLGRDLLFRLDENAPPETPVVLGLNGGRCVFFDPDGPSCRVHQSLGHDALPLACRQFPRVVVRDPRGVSITLSHYCPTAAAMLESDDVATIVQAPAAFPASSEYEGLDARECLPPLLRPDVLMDWESWWEFERLTVELLANTEGPVERSLHTLSRIVEQIRTWTPGREPLFACVQRTFERERPAEGLNSVDVEMRCREVLAAVPTGFEIPQPSGCATNSDVLKRFLAAHAFANWTALLGGGLRTWLRSVEAAYALVASGWDVRQTDLLLRHLTEPHALAAQWSSVENRRV